MLVADIALLTAECDEHVAYAGRNYLPFLLAPYGTLRPLLFNCLEIMGLGAASQDPSMEHMIGAVLALRSQRRGTIDAASLGVATTDLTWLSSAWRKHVMLKALAAASPGWIHRKYFELAVLAQIKDELKSGDLYIPHGERYDDYREQLVDEATLAQELDAYGEVSGVATDAADFVQGLRTELTTLADAMDARFSDNLHASMVDGRLVLKRLQGTQVTQAIATVDSAITDWLPPTSIVDVLVDATRWLDLHVHFRPIVGTDARVDDLLRRVITTLFCYGCNLGPTQTARSVKGDRRAGGALLGRLRRATRAQHTQAPARSTGPVAPGARFRRPHAGARRTQGAQGHPNGASESGKASHATAAHAVRSGRGLARWRRNCGRNA